MTNDAALEVLLRDIARASGLVPRADWTEQATRFLERIAERRGESAEKVLADQTSWPTLVPGLLGCLTVGETFFFRHPKHFDRLLEALTARQMADPIATALLVSAGCATGEEPYSMAIAIHRRLGASALARVRIFAVDISAASIERARAGIYGAWAFRDAPAWLQQEYFQNAASVGAWQLSDVIRRAVAFEVGSLVQVLERLQDASVSAVFCRNVAIYLVPDAVGAAYREIHRVLEPDGLLFVAPADPRPETTRFQDDGHESTSVYLRRAAAEVFGGASAPPSQRRRRMQRRGRASIPPRHAAQHAPSRVTVKRVEDEDLESSAMRLADRGDLESALAMATAFVTRHPTAPTGYWVRARITLGAGNAEAAVEDLRRTLFLMPQHRLARYWYVLAFRAAGQIKEALEQMRVLEVMLASAGDALLEDNQTTARELLDALRFVKEGLT